MKCPKCNDKGKVLDYVAERNCHGEWETVLREIPCDKCQRKPMTNEEYIHSLNTEQLAEFLIASIKKCKSCASGIGADEVADCPFGECGCHFKSEVIKWLKQPHKEDKE